MDKTLAELCAELTDEDFTELDHDQVRYDYLHDLMGLDQLDGIG
jgi:hypothetical protein